MSSGQFIGMTDGTVHRGAALLRGRPGKIPRRRRLSDMHAAAGGCRSSRLLAALRPVEDHPDGEVVRELLKPMLDPGGHEQQVARAEAVSRGAVDEHTLAADDDVHLVAPVRLLRIDASRSE